jgi:hypothetical protein
MANPRKGKAPTKGFVPYRLSAKLGVARPAHTVARHGKGLWTIEYLGKHYKRRIRRAIGIDGTVVSWVDIKGTPIEIANR